MKNKLSKLIIGFLLISSSFAVFAANTLLFTATPATNSDTIRTRPQAISYATKSLVLTCGNPHTVKISSTPDGLGNVVVDNFLAVNKTNVCPGGTDSGDCVSGSSPLDISNLIADGKHLVTFDLMDWGVILQNSNLYLVMTNCKVLAQETICHNPGTSWQRQLGVTQSVIAEHLGHGDTLGVCR